MLFAQSRATETTGFNGDFRLLFYRQRLKVWRIRRKEDTGWVELFPSEMGFSFSLTDALSHDASPRSHSHSVCMRSSPSVVPSPFSVFLLSCYYFPFVVLIACQMLSLRRLVNLNLHAPAPPSSLFLVCEHVSVVCNFFSYVRFMWHGSSSLPSHNWSV